MTNYTTLVIVCSAAAFVAPAAIKFFPSGLSYAGSVAKTGCVIKGNISINTQERIYHVPGQEFYIPTKIRPEYGERWFCTEAEARAAGWRKAFQ